MTTSTKTDDKAIHAFVGLCEFVAWWTEFQREHCQGIDATWSVNADLVIVFRFQKEVSVRRYSLDLKDRYIPKALDEIKIVLTKLREAKISCL
jgi:hypothetical protein